MYVQTKVCPSTRVIARSLRARRNHPLGILRASPRDPGCAGNNDTPTDGQTQMGFRKTDNARTARMELRLLPEEALDIAERARKAGLSASEFVRRCALGRRIAVRYDTDAVGAITDLAKAVGQLRNAVISGEAQFDNEDFRRIGAECVRTLERMT